jgi:hypothetical protein
MPWLPILGAAKDIGAGGGQVWVIGVNPAPGGDTIYRWTGVTSGNPWQDMPGAGTRIDVDDNGNAWVVNDQNNIYRWNGSAFDQIPGAARDIGAGGGEAWVIGVNPAPGGDTIYRWTGAASGNPWQETGGAGSQITLDVVVAGGRLVSNTAWVVNDVGNIYDNLFLLNS